MIFADIYEESRKKVMKDHEIFFKIGDFLLANLL